MTLIVEPGVRICSFCLLVDRLEKEHEMQPGDYEKAELHMRVAHPSWTREMST